MFLNAVPSGCCTPHNGLDRLFHFFGILSQPLQLVANSEDADIGDEATLLRIELWRADAISSIVELNAKQVSLSQTSTC
jgi:hypothetical protein